MLEGIEVIFTALEEGEIGSNASVAAPAPQVYDLVLQAACRTPNGKKLAADKTGGAVTGSMLPASSFKIASRSLAKMSDVANWLGRLRTSSYAKNSAGLPNNLTCPNRMICISANEGPWRLRVAATRIWLSMTSFGVLLKSPMK
jgi:hypothetical protein